MTISTEVTLSTSSLSIQASCKMLSGPLNFLPKNNSLGANPVLLFVALAIANNTKDKTWSHSMFLFSSKIARSDCFITPCSRSRAPWLSGWVTLEYLHFMPDISHKVCANIDLKLLPLSDCISLHQPNVQNTSIKLEHTVTAS